MHGHHDKHGNDLESPLAKFLISGGVTIAFEAIGGGHYLEMLKILKQTSNDPYWIITKRMTSSKGIVGVLDGFMPWGAMQSLVKGSSFGWGQAAGQLLLERIDIPLNKWQRTILSGGMGGFMQGIIMSPMLLLKTRVMTDPRFRTSGGFFATSLHSLKLGAELISKEGPLSLCKGMGIFSIKRSLDWGTRYAFVVLVENMVKDNYRTNQLTKAQEMLCSLAGGSLSAISTVPIDVMVATVQQANKAGTKVSIIEIYKEQLKTGGLKGTLQLSTRGLIARVSHVALTTVMMKNVASWCYTFLVSHVPQDKH